MERGEVYLTCDRQKGQRGELNWLIKQLLRVRFFYTDFENSTLDISIFVKFFVDGLIAGLWVIYVVQNTVISNSVTVTFQNYGFEFK